MRNIGLGQSRGGKVELPLVTAGSDFSFLSSLISQDKKTYSAIDALDFLLGK